MKTRTLKSIKYIISIALLLLIITTMALFFVSCKKATQDKTIKLFNTQSQTIESINLEKYLEGVVAGEIENNAPLEALKAQAVLARTFTYNFLASSESKYEGADISTDIVEAQAYNPDRVNDNIRKAVKETSGVTVKHNNEYIKAWFHSNSGGQTALAKEGLSLSIDEPAYIKSVKTKETSENTKNYTWSQTFSFSDILNALRNMGASVSTISSFKKGEVGASGRCLTFIVGGKEVNANTFRLNIGSTKLKSTLIDSITVSGDSVTFKGKGYGHGVGMSQEYACVLAKEGKNYKEIISYFFDNVEIK